MRYSFTSIWDIPFPLENVKQVMSDIENWPLWWGYVQDVKIHKQTKEIVGSVIYLKWGSTWGYSLAFDLTITEVSDNSIKATAEGDLNGVGEWKVVDKGNNCILKFDWQVTPTKKWMQIAEPIAKPFFILAHNHVMSQGKKGLISYLSHSLS